MDKYVIIAIAIPGIIFLTWLIYVFLMYIIPKQSVAEGFKAWWHDDDNII